MVAQARKKRKLTQKQLAEKVGLSYVSISKIETGKVLPRKSNLIKICNYLEIDLEKTKAVLKQVYLERHNLK